MNYSIISPPFTLEFRKMSREQLQNYQSWFISVISERIEILTIFVESSLEFKDWSPDLSADSLDTLGKWFSLNVQTRKRTVDEINELKNNLTIPIEVPVDELSNQTFSLAIDIGMYLSQIFIKQFPQLRWSQELKKKDHVDYGQPVLTGLGIRNFNPVRTIVVFAYGLVDKTRTPVSLRQIYEIWSNMARA